MSLMKLVTISIISEIGWLTRAGKRKQELRLLGIPVEG
jgi:hypothetical protein